MLVHEEVQALVPKHTIMFVLFNSSCYIMLQCPYHILPHRQSISDVYSRHVPPIYVKIS